MARLKNKTVAVIVAHPDDETLWTGGTLLSNPTWKSYIVCLCRGSDKERAAKFCQAMKVLGSEGVMGDLDDGPDQEPLNKTEVENTIAGLLPTVHFDLLISHNPSGEYTRHLRHEETGKAVIELWHSGRITANELWAFAYEDGNRKYYPRPVEQAPEYRKLTKLTWLKKYKLVTEIYGFAKGSFEEETTPRAEAFWAFLDPSDAMKWLESGNFPSGTY